MGRGVARRDPTHVTLKVKLCVCIPCFKSSSKGLSGQSTILAFSGHDMNTEMGVVIYMNICTSPDYIDSKYIWIHGSNSIGSSVSAEIPF